MDLLLVTKKGYQLWLCLLLGLCCADFCVAAEFTLTSSQPEGEFCEGPATFTCTVHDFDDDVFFSINSQAHYVCGRGRTCRPRDNQTPFTGTNFNTTTSSFSASVDNIITTYNDSLAQCNDRLNTTRSNVIVIRVDLPLTADTYAQFQCELTGFGSVSLYWNSTFNAQYGVEDYDVTVAPASCSSNQVSPNQDFNCSVLTNFTLTVTPKNCGGQRGGSLAVPLNIHTPDLVPNSPTDVTLNCTNDQVSIEWIESLKKAPNVGHCSARVRATSYILFLVSDASMLVEKNIMAASDNCSSGRCRCTFSNDGSQFRNVTIAARNEFGISEWTYYYSKANFVRGNVVLLVAVIFIASFLLST